MNIMSLRPILILIKSRKKTLLILKLMVVFDVLPKKALYDKALVFVYTTNVFPDKKMTDFLFYKE